MSSQKYQFNTDKVLLALENSSSLSDVVRFLGYDVHNTYLRKKLFSFMKENNLIVKDLKREYVRPRKIEEYLVEDGPEISSYSLKQRLLKKKILKNECNICGLTGEWNYLPISLHLDHIDGNRRNNKLSNLRILCPNCHSQTETYCGKNLLGRRKVETIRPHYSDHFDQMLIELPSFGVEGLCIKYNISKSSLYKLFKKKGHPFIRKEKIIWPSTGEIRELLSKNSYESVSRQLGVSPNSIRKRLRTYI